MSFASPVLLRDCFPDHHLAKPLALSGRPQLSSSRRPRTSNQLHASGQQKNYPRHIFESPHLLAPFKQLTRASSLPGMHDSKDVALSKLTGEFCLLPTFVSAGRLAVMTGRVACLVFRAPIAGHCRILLDLARTSLSRRVLNAGSVVGHGRGERGSTNRE